MRNPIPHLPLLRKGELYAHGSDTITEQQMATKQRRNVCLERLPTQQHHSSSA